jgi:hypothetical protein
MTPGVIAILGQETRPNRGQLGHQAAFGVWWPSVGPVLSVWSLYRQCDKATDKTVANTVGPGLVFPPAMCGGVPDPPHMPIMDRRLKAAACQQS